MTTVLPRRGSQMRPMVMPTLVEGSTRLPRLQVHNDEQRNSQKA